MGSTENLYPGADYGLDPTYDVPEGYGNFTGYRTPASSLFLTTVASTANQLKEVSDKLNLGAKGIEVQGVSSEALESIPEQHLEEINRLRKLAKVDLTFHGPLVEPTGIGRDGWEEEKRVQAERQMLSAIERGHKLNPKGNVVITFHSSSGLPDMHQKVKTDDGEKIESLWIVDEREGKFMPISPKDNPLTGEKADPLKELDRLNKENWFRTLSQASFHTMQGKSALMTDDDEISEVAQKNGIKLTNQDYIDIYQKSQTPEWNNFLENKSEIERRLAESITFRMSHGHTYLKESYNDLQELFNKAWQVAKKDSPKDLEKLKAFKEEMGQKLQYYNDPQKLPEFGDAIMKGIQTLNSINPPKIFKPLNDFAVDKASDTFSNIALNSYKKFGSTSPIISVENPPAGGGLSRADDLRDLVKNTRKKFVKKAVSELGISQKDAEKQAKKLIGVTWDVGHINMIRKYGYDEEDLKKETKKVAPFVKHVHLSDNFGFEHTELPMGMGNVPTKEHLDIISKENKNVRKVIETGNWYQHFQTNPLPHTLEAFGSPIYSMQMSPYWNQQLGMQGSYFAGYGLNPDIHHSIYGSGFGNLPVELGGQMQGVSRLSGTPNN